MLLTLTARAPVGAALAQGGVLDGGAAHRAGFALAVVDAERVLEVAELAVAVFEIAQAAAARFDGFGQHLLDGRD